MTVYLVRHAEALGRRSWDGDDSMRPLAPKGQRQSAKLADLLRDAPIRRVLSSPAVRCVDTVRPLAKKLDIRVEATTALAEGASVDKAWTLLTKVAGRKGDSVLCAHGDLVPDLVAVVARDGASTDPPQWAKGSTWTLEWDGDRFTSARYAPPP